jgi:hypothetical protein
MAKYDLERLLADIEALMVANLNTKLAAINTEKNDAITLKEVSSDAYFFQGMNSKQANYNPFVIYSIEDIQSSAMEGLTIQSAVIQIALVLEDKGEDTGPNVMKRMLRYQRALEEIFEENFQLIENGVKLKVQSLMPGLFALEDSSEFYRVVGINLSASIA